MGSRAEFVRITLHAIHSSDRTIGFVGSAPAPLQAELIWCRVAADDRLEVSLRKIDSPRSPLGNSRHRHDSWQHVAARGSQAV